MVQGASYTYLFLRWRYRNTFKRWEEEFIVQKEIGVIGEEIINGVVFLNRAGKSTHMLNNESKDLRGFDRQSLLFGLHSWENPGNYPTTFLVCS